MEPPSNGRGPRSWSTAFKMSHSTTEQSTNGPNDDRERVVVKAAGEVRNAEALKESAVAMEEEETTTKKEKRALGSMALSASIEPKARSFRERALMHRLCMMVHICLLQAVTPQTRFVE